VIPMEKTQGQMIKFRNADDGDFQKVSKILTIIVAELAKQGDPMSS
jgi:hypothetical protein